MIQEKYEYVIVGGGLAGASSIKGIRELDNQGSVLLVCEESHLPYDRPPLSKKLWFEDSGEEDIILYDNEYYIKNNITVSLNTTVVSLNTKELTIVTNNGNTISYGKLLLATGGSPRRLAIPGGDLEGIYYYRYLDDYISLKNKAKANTRAVIIGGGFIGSEMAAALAMNDVQVTMLFPEKHICGRVFPDDLAFALHKKFEDKGVSIHAGDIPDSISKNGSTYITHSKNGEVIESDIIIAGIGILPSDKLAGDSGLAIDKGIIVDDTLRTSDRSVFAAGDVARFPYSSLNKSVRIEHWDNSLNQGELAGKNMAGENESYTYMPMFFSDLFDFGYEAVGDVNVDLEIISDWQTVNETGVLYYMKEGRVRGVMLCNVWEKVEEARELIRSGKVFKPDELIGLIH